MEDDLKLTDVSDAIRYKKALEDSYNFYHTDVEPRRQRERTLFQQKLYTNPNPIESTKIGVGDNQVTPSAFGGNNYTGDFTTRAGYHSGYKGVVISPQELSNINRLAQTMTHEFAHEDQFPNRKAPIYQRVLQTADAVRNNSQGLTRNEVNYLKNAYGLPNGHKNNVGETSMLEMRATNRELRHSLQQKFKEQYGRDPENIEELDLYIEHFSNEELLDILHNQNGYGYYYSSPYTVDKNGRLLENFNNFDEKANKVKQALIHVAFNQNSSRNGVNTAYAHSGGKLNYLNFFK